MPRYRLCLLALLLLMAGCSKKKDNQTTPTGPQPDPTQPAVTVNGVSMSRGEVNAILQQRFNHIYGRQPGQFTESFLSQRRKEMRHEIMERFVVQQLLDAEVKRQGIEVTQDDINAALAKQADPNMTVETFLERATQDGRDPKQAMTQLQKATAYQMIYDQQCEGMLDVNEAEIEQYYGTHKRFQPFTEPAQCHCRHILIDPNQQAPGDVPEIADQKALEQAEILLQQLRDGGDFAKLAQTYSHCPTAPQGGDLGYFSQGDMVEPFNSVAFSLDVNEISEVVKTQFGYHIIQSLDKIPAVTLALDEAREIVIEQLTQKKKMDILNAYLKSLKAAAEIHYAKN